MMGLPSLSPTLRLGGDHFPESGEKAPALHDRRMLHDAAEHAVALGEALGIPAVDLGAVLAKPVGKPLSDDHVCTAEEAAALDFEGWTDECPVPSNAEWGRLGSEHLPFARLAWMVNTKSKAELMQVLAAMDAEDDTRVERLCEDIRDTASFFKTLHEVVDVAELRLLVACRP